MSAILFGSIETITDTDSIDLDEHGEHGDSHAVTPAGRDESLHEPVEARPGVLDLIERAKERHVRLALITASPSTAPVLIDRIGAGVRDAFEFILDVTTLGKAEVDGSTFCSAIEHLGLDAEDVVAIVDTPNGVTAAKSAGLWTAVFARGAGSALDRSEADYVIGQLDDAAASALFERFR